MGGSSTGINLKGGFSAIVSFFSGSTFGFASWLSFPVSTCLIFGFTVDFVFAVTLSLGPFLLLYQMAKQQELLSSL